MCFKYEEEYSDTCFDYLWSGWEITNSIKEAFDEFGIDVVEDKICKEEFFELLKSWHKRKLIKPQEV